MSQNHSEDPVHSPTHYQIFPELGIETIHISQSILSYEEFLGAMKFNVIKYTLRADKKNGVEDWEKIKKYSEWVIELIKTGTITVNGKFNLNPD